MKILVTGGTGFVGQRLVKALYKNGHQAIITTRNPHRAQAKESTPAKFIKWDYSTEDFPTEALEGIEGIINLMGENISSKRWSDDQKKKIYNSRVKATQKLVSTCQNHLTKPLEFLISGSAIGIYPANDSQEISEKSELAEGFLADVCKDWEKEALKLSLSKRNIISRTGVVLGPESGALSQLLPLFKWGLGGPIGSGKMTMSWIHIDDMVKAFLAFIENDSYQGIYNMVSPNPVTNKEFTKALAKAVHRPAIMPAPPFMLKLVFGEMSSIILDSQRVIPHKLQEESFSFDHPNIEEALQDLL